MQIKFPCPHCRTNIEADTEFSGLYANCPSCKLQFMVPAVRIEPGTTIDDFRIEALLGRGAMGEVYLANQISLDRKVALKVLPPALTENTEYVGRFMNEMRMIGRLNHPNIVSAFKAGADNGYHFLAMTYVDGVTVDERIEEDGVISEREAMKIALSVCDALAYAWDNFRMLHRDIKPSNIMLENNGMVRLMDMGLSKSMVDDPGMTKSSMTIGTPHYMSPEQAEGEKILDFRTDMFSLGAALYHMVVGHSPFRGDTTVSVLYKLVDGDFTPVREENPRVSESCESIIHRMLEVERNNRYNNWDKLADDIRAALRGKRIVYQPSKQMGKKQKLRNNDTISWAYALAGMGMALVCFVIIAFLFQWAVNRAEEDEASPTELQGVLHDDTPKQTGLEAMWNRLQRLRREQPNEYGQALELLKLIVEKGDNTEYEAMARHEMKTIYEERTELLRTTKKELLGKSKELTDNHQYDKALMLLLEYQGPLKKQLDTFIEERAAEIRKQAEAYLKEQKEKRLIEQTQRFQRRLIELLLTHDFEGASLMVNDPPELLNSKKPELITDLRKIVNPLCEVNRVLKESFRDQQGQTITVRLKRRTFSLKIMQVGDTWFKGLRTVALNGEKGYVAKRIVFDQLHLYEVARRFKILNDFPAKFAQSLLWYHAGKQEKASDTLRDLVHPFTDQLAATIEGRKQLDMEAADKVQMRVDREILPGNNSQALFDPDRFSLSHKYTTIKETQSPLYGPLTFESYHEHEQIRNFVALAEKRNEYPFEDDVFRLFNSRFICGSRGSGYIVYDRKVKLNAPTPHITVLCNTAEGAWEVAEMGFNEYHAWSAFPVLKPRLGAIGGGVGEDGRVFYSIVTFAKDGYMINRRYDVKSEFLDQDNLVENSGDEQATFNARQPFVLSIGIDRTVALPLTRVLVTVKQRGNVWRLHQSLDSLLAFRDYEGKDWLTNIVKNKAETEEAFDTGEIAREKIKILLELLVKEDTGVQFGYSLRGSGTALEKLAVWPGPLSMKKLDW